MRVPARRMGPSGGLERGLSSSDNEAAGLGVSPASSAFVRGVFKRNSTPPQPTLSQPEATVKITAIARQFVRMGLRFGDGSRPRKLVRTPLEAS
jgi:hypothetical protein